jgi:PhoH-like ATPase
MTKKLSNTKLPRQYVLDTNILISDPSAPYQFDEHDVVITMTVLEELDKLKDSHSSRHSTASKEARVAIQTLKQIINGASPSEIEEGVCIPGSDGRLRVMNDFNIGATALPNEVPDNRIISAAIALQSREHKKDDSLQRDTVLVTKDINLQLKARVAGLLHVEDYLNEHQIDDIAYLASGYLELSNDILDTVADVECQSGGDGEVYYIIKKSEFGDYAESLYVNQYLFNEQSENIFCVHEITHDEVRLMHKSRNRIMALDAFGIKPRSILQGLALDALLDPEIDMVQLTGPAGSGKTLLALAAAFEQTRMGSVNRFDKIMVTRTATDMAEDIGFLPGNEEEKMMPWLAAFTDSLEVLFGGDVNGEGNTEDKMGFNHLEQTIRHAMEKANLQFKSVNFMRGRNLVNTIVILDESQNMTPHLTRSMITRVGQGSKMVMLGNLGQIDAKYVTPLTSGLTHAVEKMKPYEGGSTIALPGGERSRLSAFAEENL